MPTPDPQRLDHALRVLADNARIITTALGEVHPFPMCLPVPAFLCLRTLGDIHAQRDLVRSEDLFHSDASASRWQQVSTACPHLTDGAKHDLCRMLTRWYELLGYCAAYAASREDTPATDPVPVAAAAQRVSAAVATFAGRHSPDAAAPADAVAPVAVRTGYVAAMKLRAIRAWFRFGCGPAPGDRHFLFDCANGDYGEAVKHAADTAICDAVDKDQADTDEHDIAIATQIITLIEVQDGPVEVGPQARGRA